MLVALSVPLAAHALPPALEQAKNQGVVGEQGDGYLGYPKGSAPADVQRLVDDVNAKRRQSYEEIARKNKTDVTKVAAVAGARLVEREPAGHWVKLTSGWVRK